MLCEKCGKNPANTHIKTVINGEVTELNLCNSCAESLNLMNNDSLFDDMLFSIFSDNLPLKQKKIEVLRCPACNCSFEDISKTGKVGCADCYNTFKEQLLPYINRVQGSVMHKGKNITIQKSEDNSSDLIKLKEELKSLVAKENFEEAAIVRDKIKKIEEEGI